MVAPFFNFTLGDMFDKQPMFFSSLNYTIDTASTWEIKPGLRLPKLIQVSADMRFIDKNPYDVKTDREIFSLKKNLLIYRVMYIRNSLLFTN